MLEVFCQILSGKSLWCLRICVFVWANLSSLVRPPLNFHCLPLPLPKPVSYSPFKGLMDLLGGHPQYNDFHHDEVTTCQTFLIAFNTQFYCYLDASGKRVAPVVLLLFQWGNFTNIGFKNSSLAGGTDGYAKNLAHAAFLFGNLLSPKNIFWVQSSDVPNKIE